MKPYERKPHYYETDRMGIIHHSNYIRWLEEARIAYMDGMGASYAGLEESGICIPVLSVECKYISMVRFGETVLIEVKIEEYTGSRLKISYRLTDKDTGELRTTGSSSHCFLNASGRPVSLKKANPTYDSAFRRSMEENVE